MPVLTALKVEGEATGPKALVLVDGVDESFESLVLDLEPMPTTLFNDLIQYCPTLKALQVTSRTSWIPLMPFRIMVMQAWRHRVTDDVEALD